MTASNLPVDDRAAAVLEHEFVKVSIEAMADLAYEIETGCHPPRERAAMQERLNAMYREFAQLDLKYDGVQA